MSNDNRILDRIGPYRKAAAAVLLPPIITAWTAAPGGFTVQEWLLIAASAIATGGTVYAAPNATRPTVWPPPDDAT